MNHPCSAKDIRMTLGCPGLRVLFCCVLHDLESDAYEAYAVVEEGGRREVQVAGWSVFLLNPDAPLSEYLLKSTLGEVFLCYQVVSVDGSPILSESKRQHVGQDGRHREREWRNGSGSRDFSMAA
jgi:hypothetical protein